MEGCDLPQLSISKNLSKMLRNLDKSWKVSINLDLAWKSRHSQVSIEVDLDRRENLDKFLKTGLDAKDDLDLDWSRRRDHQA